MDKKKPKYDGFVPICFGPSHTHSNIISIQRVWCNIGRYTIDMAVIYRSILTDVKFTIIYDGRNWYIDYPHSRYDLSQADKAILREHCREFASSI